ncbi:hypothetical protein [Bacillus nitratireducens]|uniref:hypothetical protein n=1 Tax=Bacillus nitratireducens TaxID=2026193 RepID=UPI001BABF5AC|nr:hypothetical protein [Bacillus nitratireducens]
MEFLFDLVKEFVKSTVREVSAYYLRRSFWIRTTKNPLRAVGSKRVGSAKRNNL